MCCFKTRFEDDIKYEREAKITTQKNSDMSGRIEKAIRRLQIISETSTKLEGT